MRIDIKRLLWDMKGSEGRISYSLVNGEAVKRKSLVGTIDRRKAHLYVSVT